MESVGHRNLHRLHAEGGEQLYSLLHRFLFARYHGLGGTVLVGGGHITFDALEFGLHLVAGGGDGSHLPRVIDLDIGHLFCAAGDGAQTIFESEHPAGYGGGVFAKAVAYHHIRLYAVGGKQAHHRRVGGEDGGLGHLCLLDGVFAFGKLFGGFARLGPDDIGKGGVYHPLEDAVRLIKSILHHLVFGGEVLHHVHILRTLSGEHEAYFRAVERRFERINALHFKMQGGNAPHIAGLRYFLKEGQLFLQFGGAFGGKGNGKSRARRGI